MLFRYLLKILIRKGTLRVVTANRKIYQFGNGMAPRVTIKLHRKSLEWSLGLNPDLKIGEAYMDGTLTIEQGTLADFLYLMMSNDTPEARDSHALFSRLAKLHGRTQWLKQFNPLGRARRNVARHYDLPDDLYEFFLDTDKQYSCAYFTRPGSTLEQAQRDKKRHIASKLF